MTKIEIYTTPTCPYCFAAKRLLDKKKLAYEEIDVSRDPNKRGEMVKRSNGGRTVPQIFINGSSIGGSDELYRLNVEGKLEDLLLVSA